MSEFTHYATTFRKMLSARLKLHKVLKTTFSFNKMTTDANIKGISKIFLLLLNGTK